MAVDGAHGVQPLGEFDDYVISESSADAKNVDLSSEGSAWTFFGKALLGTMFLLFLLFRKKLCRLWSEFSFEMEVMSPFIVSLEKFVVSHKIDRDKVPAIYSILMKRNWPENIRFCLKTTLREK